MASSADAVATYKVEPYVAAADVYAVAPHEGRGGWTWYTGSAGWMYRLIVESLLGLTVENDRLRLRPVPRADWPSYQLSYRYRETIYRITVAQPVDGQEPGRLTLDGLPQQGDLQLVNDRIEHEVVLLLSRRGGNASCRCCRVLTNSATKRLISLTLRVSRLGPVRA